jgi:hypothetical protein
VVNLSAPHCKNTGRPRRIQPDLLFLFYQERKLSRSTKRKRRFSLVILILVIIFIVVIFIGIVMRLMHLVIPELPIGTILFDQILV